MFKSYSQMPKIKTTQVPICEWINKIYYSLTLNNTDLNCLGPFIHEFFSVVNTAVLHDLRLVKSVDVKWQNGGNLDMEGQI